MKTQPDIPLPPKPTKKIKSLVSKNGHQKIIEPDIPALDDMEEMYSEIEALLKMSTYSPERKYWLDIHPAVNAVLGSREQGIPYGKIFELSGLEHSGKTTLTTYFAGMAQQDAAAIGYIDIENSRDQYWANRMGLDLSKTLCLYPRLTTSKKKKKKDDDDDDRRGPSRKLAQLQGAEDIFAQAEIAMELFRQKGFKKQFWMLDSIAMLSTRKALEAGTDSNMRTKVDRAMFLSETLPRWAGLAQNYNAMIFLINQIRLKVGMVFGDPQYSPGGKALDHACSIRARVRRLKNGYARKNGKIIGLVGIMRNMKNKAGGGSVADAKCGYKIRWNVTPARVEFMTVDEAEAELKGE